MKYFSLILVEIEKSEKSEKVNDAFEDEMIKSEIQEAISQVQFLVGTIRHW